MVKTLHDLRVWNQAIDLAVDLYDATRDFPREELYSLTTQIRRSGVSIPSNIAEGQGRLTNGEWKQFLGNARGSLYELETQLVIALRLKLMEPEEFATLRKSIAEVGRGLTGLIRYVESLDQKAKRRLATGNRQPVTSE